MPFDSLVLDKERHEEYIPKAEIVIGSYYMDMMNYKYIPVLHLLDS